MSTKRHLMTRKKDNLSQKQYTDYYGDLLMSSLLVVIALCVILGVVVAVNHYIKVLFP